MKKSYLVRLLCLGVSAVVLVGALTAVAVTGSPYETLKNAALNTMTQNNGTMETEMSLVIDGKKIEFNRSYIEQGDNSTYNKNYDDTGAELGFSYNAKDFSVWPNILYENGKHVDDGWYGLSVENYRYDRFQHSISGLKKDDVNSASMRFGLLLTDLIVGDLKNNINMSEENGVRYISGSLTGDQMPEIIKAGIDMFAENSSSGFSSEKSASSFDADKGVRTFTRTYVHKLDKTISTYEQTFEPITEEMKKDETMRYLTFGTFIQDGVEYNIKSEKLVDERRVAATPADYENSYLRYTPISSLDVSYIHGEAEINDEGFVNSFSFVVNASSTDIFGKTSDLEVNLKLKLSNINSTNPQCPIPDIEKVLSKSTGDSLKGSVIYFKLNNDGTVDEWSITANNPYDKSPAREGSKPIPVMD